MKIYSEKSLRDFEFWSGACDTVEELTYDDLDVIESYLEHCDDMDEGYTETEINDFMWFERDFIAELLGYEDFNELMNEREG